MYACRVISKQQALSMVYQVLISLRIHFAVFTFISYEQYFRARSTSPLRSNAALACWCQVLITL